MIKSRQIAKALYELSQEAPLRQGFGGAKNLEDKFFDFMKKSKLAAQIPAVLYHLGKIAEVEKEKKGVSIESAHELKTHTLAEIKKYLETCLPAGRAEDAEVTLKINKNIVAGFTAKWQGKFYDMSFATGLKKIEEAIIR